MALDSSIPLQAKVGNPLGAFTSSFDASMQQGAELRKVRSKQRLADLTLSAEEKKLKRQDTYREVLQGSLNEKGSVDSKRAYQGLNQAGLFKEAEQIKSNWFKAQDAQKKRADEQRNRQSEMAITLGKMSSAVIDSKNPVEAFMMFKQDAVKKGLPLSQGLLNYMPTDEEIQDGRLDSKAMQELQFYNERVLTPEQRIARAKLGNEGLSPEALALKKQEQDVKKFGLGVKLKGYEVNEKKLDAELRGLGDGTNITEEAFKRETKLRSEYLKQNKGFQDVGDAYNRVQVVGAAETAAGDLALIFNYMKMLDPGSVVRESEFRTAEEAKAWFIDLQEKDPATASKIPAFARLAIQKATTGKKLLPSQRKDFMARSKDLMTAATSGNIKSIKTYTKMANKYGLDATRVAIDLGRDDDNLSNKNRKWEKIED